MHFRPRRAPDDLVAFVDDVKVLDGGRLHGD
jgi:hypothetical protein